MQKEKFMKIGIDIDGVLTNEDEYILSCTSKYCYDNNLKGITNPYNYEYNKLDWNQETIDDYRSIYFDEYVNNYPIRIFASEVIKKLKNDGHQIFIITGRNKSYEDTPDGEKMRIKVKKWLEKHDVIYDKLIFAKVPKINELKENEIDLMIEDSPSTIPLIKDIVKVFCFDARYNQCVNFDNVTRVFSWYDIYMKILEISDKG